LKLVHVQIHDRRNVEGQGLGKKKTADHGKAERAA
jgi:hypothetical protein